MYFNSLVRDRKAFIANIINFDLSNNAFKIELYDQSGVSVNKILIDKGFAKSV
jgi:hypothetical protein